MGGMSIMALAEARPDLLDRVYAVAFLATSAEDIADLDFGFAGGQLVHKFGGPGLRVLARLPKAVEQGRKIGADLESLMVHRFSYSSPVPKSLVRFTAQMIAATPLEVIADFVPTFQTHDRRGALAAFSDVEVLIMVGSGDLMTPARKSEELAAFLPAAEHIVLAQTGHNIMLEQPVLVNECLDSLIGRAQTAIAAGGAAKKAGRRPFIRRMVTPLRHRAGGRRHGAA